jgi:hypothetical protein
VLLQVLEKNLVPWMQKELEWMMVLEVKMGLVWKRTGEGMLSIRLVCGTTHVVAYSSLLVV